MTNMNTLQSFINQILELKNELNKFPEFLWAIAIAMWFFLLSGISEQLYLRKILDVNHINLVMIPIASLVFYLITNSAIKLKKNIQRQEIYKEFKRKVLK